jgi:acyl carrier protein
MEGCVFSQMTGNDMTQEELQSKVRQFIRKNILFDDKVALEDDQSLLGSGVLDSTGILELITFLEETCGVKFENNELVSENFDTIARISAFIMTKVDLQKV